ncbi:MAG: hypothetical protein KGI38_06130 [Thaumarchaeota archaeon]|nr:hypothetical protein [Nitrososphaerota archaeon]
MRIVEPSAAEDEAVKFLMKKSDLLLIIELRVDPEDLPPLNIQGLLNEGPLPAGRGTRRGGAMPMIEEGAMVSPKVDYVFGLQSGAQKSLVR